MHEALRCGHAEHRGVLGLALVPDEQATDRDRRAVDRARQAREHGVPARRHREHARAVGREVLSRLGVAARVDAVQAVVVRDVVDVPVLAADVDPARAERRRRVQVVAVVEHRIARGRVV